ncbi:phage holin family protein [Limosilactobacillus fermentum]
MTHAPHPSAWPGAFFEGIYSMYHNYLIWAFVGIIVLDVVSGIVKGLVTKKMDSSVGLAGLTKHFFIIFATMIIYPFLDATEFDELANTWVIFYIGFYLLSFIENWGQMGLPIPDAVKQYVNKLSDSSKGDDRK